ncbi:MAG TPA: hypothetical protein VFB99_10425 [Vicinamibacterales bacterium]|nr:hypothetical protein [Vicinamibacterales bacterium]
MTTDEILSKVREARAICDAATPGPWATEENDVCWQLFAEVRLDGEVVHPQQLIKAPKRGTVYAEYWPNAGDSRFITSARTGWPEALDLIEQLVAKIQDWEAADEIRRRTQREVEASRAELDAVVAKARKLLGDLPDLPPEPTPGKMRVTASVPVTYDVSPGQALAFLKRTKICLTESAAIAWLKPEALEKLARMESRSTGEVLRDIAAMEEA